MEAAGDFGLNLTNSRAASELRDLGLCSLTASFELTLPQLRDRAALLRPKEISPDYDGPIEPGTIADPAKYAEAIASGVLRELTPEEAAAVQPVLVEVEPG